MSKVIPSQKAVQPEMPNPVRHLNESERDDVTLQLQLRQGFINVLALMLGGALLVLLYADYIVIEPYVTAMFWAGLLSVSLHPAKKALEGVFERGISKLPQSLWQSCKQNPAVYLPAFVALLICLQSKYAVIICGGTVVFLVTLVSMVNVLGPETRPTVIVAFLVSYVLGMLGLFAAFTLVEFSKEMVTLFQYIADLVDSQTSSPEFQELIANSGLSLDMLEQHRQNTTELLLSFRQSIEGKVNATILDAVFDSTNREWASMSWEQISTELASLVTVFVNDQVVLG
eukprot:TRINITY_DN628_c0_g2_i1.p1 TRINITY_DN628_c0_g2~~TRINITY_DN628_c0_g2_i1.p1  ORF type:complete len:299 (+),score=98.76 TRINITY_DN628_c0_g2_i1:42-899(+)